MTYMYIFESREEDEEECSYFY